MEELYKPHEITVIDSDGNKLTLTVCWDADIYEWSEQFKVILKWLTFSDELINDIFCDEECDLKNNQDTKEFDSKEEEEDNGV